MNEKHIILYYLDSNTWSSQLQSFFQFLNFFKKNLKFQEKLERYLAKLHFLSLNQIPKMVILKVTIKVGQGTSTFGTFPAYKTGSS